MNRVKICNGVSIPQIGFGTWQITDRVQLKSIIRWAYEDGYRLFDTAAAYSNEIAIGKAIQDMHINRDELIISDKVWNTSRGHDAVIEACKRSLKKMKTDYFDIYLIHWPASPKLYSDWREINADTWSGMEDLYNEGLVRVIGVCNFKSHHLQELEKSVNIMPMINQFEYHPGMTQEDTVKYCNSHNITIEASSPLGNGKILTDKCLVEIARVHNASPAQVCLRWSYQKGNIIIPKTINKNRLLENISIFDLELTADEMDLIDSIPYCGGIGIDADEVIEFG